MTLAIDGTPAYGNNNSSPIVVTSPTTTFGFGKIIVMSAQGGSAATAIVSITGAGLSFTRRALVITSGGAPYEEWQSDIPSGGIAGVTITINYGSGFGGGDVSVFCVSNGGNTAGLAFDSGGPQTIGTFGNQVNMTTVTAITFVFGGYLMSSTAAPLAGTSWTGILAGQAGSFHLTEYQTFASAQNVILEPNISNTDTQGGIMDAIIAGSGSPPPYLQPSRRIITLEDRKTIYRIN